MWNRYLQLHSRNNHRSELDVPFSAELLVRALQNTKLVLNEVDVDTQADHQEKHTQVDELDATHTSDCSHDDFLEVRRSTEELGKGTDDQLDEHINTADDSGNE